MSEVLVQFDEPQCALDGRPYIALVRGQMASEDLWEAWIEFFPIDGGNPVRTARETEQFSRGDLRYWAARLTREYLEGALARALTQTSLVPRPVPVLALPDTIADDDEYMVFETNALMLPMPVLDPFAVYRQHGTYTLRQELRSLDARHLQDIIAAYDIPDLDTGDMARTFEDALAEQIVAEVQQRVGSGHREQVGSGAETH
jgi:hypothetical protein